MLTAGFLKKIKGTGYGAFACVPDHIDVKNEPGVSPVPEPTLKGMAVEILTLKSILASPAFLWNLMALSFYFLFPYDFSATGTAAVHGPFSLQYFKERLPPWMALVMMYFGFWHVTTYVAKWATRPMITEENGRIPPTKRIGRMLHNIFYCAAVTTIWVGVENIFAHCWATGKLPFISDADVVNSFQQVFSGVDNGIASPWYILAVTAAGFQFAPLFCHQHFYFVHRLIHFRPLYNLVHSLHHRNTDIEPFAGLCMHPVEGLWYVSAVVPHVFLALHPTTFLFHAFHFLLAPAAGHSGWEDHFQADTFHYFHHRYFECNYGGGTSAYFDVLFGSWCPTWREALPIKGRLDAKATINVFKAGLGLQTASYQWTVWACFALWGFVAMSLTTGATAPYPALQKAVNLAQTQPLLFSAVIGFWPVIAGLAWHAMMYSPSARADAGSIGGSGKGSNSFLSSFIKPFDRRPAWETLLHIVLGLAAGPGSITAMVYAAIA